MRRRNEMKKREILEKEGVKILCLEGSPYEMGYQHGEALKEEINWLQSNLKNLFGTYEGILGKLAIPIFRFSSKFLEKNIPKEFRDEMRGISDGAGVDYSFVRLINLVDELGEIFYSYLRPFCSCFVVKNGEEIMWGRNLDYLFGEILPSRSVLFVYLPDKGFPFISLAWPGVVGVSTGISTRFSLVLNSSPAEARIFKGIPQLMFTRKLIQYSENLEEAVGIALSLPATIGQNITPVSKDDAKVVEISPRKKAVRSFQDGYITVTNHFQIPEMQKEQGVFRIPRGVSPEFAHTFSTLEGSKERAEKMKTALSQKNIGPEKAMEILDQVSGQGTVQSVVAIPQKEEFWVARRSQPPVTKGEWIHFGIDDLL
jgi:predicted choloylglycine hydrolase